MECAPWQAAKRAVAAVWLVRALPASACHLSLSTVAPQPELLHQVQLRLGAPLTSETAASLSVPSLCGRVGLLDQSHGAWRSRTLRSAGENWTMRSVHAREQQHRRSRGRLKRPARCHHRNVGLSERLACALLRPLFTRFLFTNEVSCNIMWVQPGREPFHACT